MTWERRFQEPLLTGDLDAGILAIQSRPQHIVPMDHDPKVLRGKDDSGC